MGQHITTETTLHERIVVTRPLHRDVVAIYKIRYALIETENESGKLIYSERRSYYGGIDGTWNEYQPFDTIDYEAPGCISMDGRNWMMLRAGIKEMEDDERTQLQSVMQDIVKMFQQEGSTT